MPKGVFFVKILTWFAAVQLPVTSTQPTLQLQPTVAHPAVVPIARLPLTSATAKSALSASGSAPISSSSSCPSSTGSRPRSAVVGDSAANASANNRNTLAYRAPAAPLNDLQMPQDQEHINDQFL